MKNLLYLIFALVIIFLVAFFYFNQEKTQNRKETTENIKIKNIEQAFLSGGLSTNTTISSIALELVLSGLPKKDQIPSLTRPKFSNIEDIENDLKEESLGIFLDIKGDQRFYPYSILVWHEIINDVVGGSPVLVSFCPLCGTAIVFDPVIDGKPTLFGVSGKLYESNLLMYDKKTESLWSQALGKAVVGDLTGKELSLIPFQLIEFKELKEKHPNAKVLSKDTGYVRDYDHYPYGDYETNDERFYFPVSVSDKRFPSKELMYIVDVNKISYAIQVSALPKDETIKIQAENFYLELTQNGGEISVKRSDSQKIIAGYYSMWFSWAAHHQENGEVWPK